MWLCYIVPTLSMWQCSIVAVLYKPYGRMKIKRVFVIQFGDIVIRKCTPWQ